MSAENSIYNVLSIAGSDPSGGAGIQADLKAFAANGVYGMAVLTALTAQNTQGVAAIHLVPTDFIREQIDSIFADIQVDAIKIGMAANADIAHAIAASLQNKTVTNIVLDPVMVAKGGAPLLVADAIDAVREQLLPLATVLTPNLPEAATLLDCAEATSRAAMIEQGRALLALGPKAILMKGGHLNQADSPDLLITQDQEQDQEHWLEAERVASNNTHGTGCTLSSALAANLAKKLPMDVAARNAKSYITKAIQGAEQLTVGSGHGPTHHFHEFW